MKIKFKLETIIGLSLLLFTFSSCLKKNLPEFPLFNGNGVENVHVEHRYKSGQMFNGDSVVAYQKLNLISKTVDESLSVINIVLGVPAASGTFTTEERKKVSSNKLWLYFDISTAASMKATGSTPKPGDPTDCSKPLTYEVTAANGQKRNWTINVTLNAINKYEGRYTANGYMYHPSVPRAITNIGKDVLTAGPNSVTVDLGDLGGSGYRALIEVNPTTNQLTISTAVGASGGPYTMFTSGLPAADPGYTAAWAGSAQCNNTYDPATKTFYVRYGYMGSGGWRVTEEIIKMD